MDFALSWIPCVKVFVAPFRPTQNFSYALMELSCFTEVYLSHEVLVIDEYFYTACSAQNDIHPSFSCNRSIQEDFSFSKLVYLSHVTEFNSQITNISAYSLQISLRVPYVYTKFHFLDSEKPRGDEPIKYVCMYVAYTFQSIFAHD